MTKPIVYLANNCGFSAICKLALQPIEDTLIDMGYEIWEPFKRFNAVNTSDIDDPLRIANSNIADIIKCDLVFAILNGEPPDTGVFFEVGYAAAIGKPRVFFRDDFRMCTDSKSVPANLMIASGFEDIQVFKSHCYADLAELKAEDKFLAIFAKKWHVQRDLNLGTLVRS